MAWTIDTAHSQIQFSVRHMMISNVRGRFENFKGTIDLDENKLEDSKVDITIDVAAINTRDTQRDQHLRSLDFFQSDKYPNITYVSKKVNQTDATHAKITGDLTIRGIKKEVVLDVEFNGQAGDHIRPDGKEFTQDVLNVWAFRIIAVGGVYYCH